MTETTIFQKIINEEIPCDKLYEDKFCIAFNDIQAQAPVHFLVIPKKPIISLLECIEQDTNLLGHLLFVGSKIAKSKNLTNWRTVINTGAESGQTVFHLHIHFLSGRKMNADGLLARCIQHEVDHLKGVLFVDRVTSKEDLKKELMKEGYKMKDVIPIN